MARQFAPESAQPSYWPCLGIEGVALAEVGARLRLWILHSPGRIRELAGPWRKRLADTQRGAGVSRDLLPLPLPRLEHLRGPGGDEATGPRQLPRDTVALRTARNELSWLWVVVACLNFLHCGRRPGSEELSVAAGPLSEAQQKALSQLRKACARMCLPTELPAVNWFRELKKVRLDYEGQEVRVGQSLTLEQVEPALPAKGAAARIDAHALATGFLREALADPWLIAKPRAAWPPRFPKARVWCEPAEWVKIVTLCLERGIFGLVDAQDVVHHNGQPLLNGCFGVSKGVPVREGGPEVLRLIINLIPLNMVQEILEGDIRTLPFVGQFSGLEVLEDETAIVFSEEDLTCSFYLFRFPPAWLPWMALSRGFDVDEHRSLVERFAPHLAKSRFVYPSVHVMPMGWKSACGLLQWYHRQWALSPSPVGAGLPAFREIRKDRPLPPEVREALPSWFLIYIDNFMVAEWQHLSMLAAAQEMAGDWQQLMREAYANHGAARSEKKAVERSPFVQTLGVEIDGLAGTVGTPRDFDIRLLALSAFCLNRADRGVPPRMLAVLLGRWVRKLQFRREGMSALKLLWQRLGSQDPRPWSIHEAEELVTLMGLTPLFFIDLRLEVSPLVTCSDASEQGCGVCRSGGITELGRRELPELTRTLSAGGARSFILVGLFDGIGGLRRAVELLGLEPEAYFSSEPDEQCQRVVSTMWPDAIHWPPVGKIGRKELEELRRRGATSTLVVVGAGFPCQPHSMLNPERKGWADGRAEVAHLVPELLSALAEWLPWAKVVHLIENVASMPDESISKCSALFGSKPYRCCPYPRSHCRRPRLFWLNWQVPSRPLAELVDVGPFVEIDFSGKQVAATNWLDPGWELAAGSQGIIPTFVTAVSREKPGENPKGLLRATAAAKKRWKRDRYRFAPYQYAWKYGLVRSKFSGPRRIATWRTASVTERELLLRFRRDHTLAGFRSKQRKEKEAVTDVRLSMVGNSFHCGVVAYLLGWTFKEQGFLETEPEVSLLDVPSPEAHHGGEELSMVRSLMRHVSHKGRLVSSVAASGACHRWPRQEINPQFWNWRVVVRHPWSTQGPAEHINKLELRSGLAALRWRLRAAKNVATRGLHLQDSMVAISCMAHGRTASSDLAPVMERISATTLAASFQPFLGFSTTERNPADKPSRNDATKKSSAQ